MIALMNSQISNLDTLAPDDVNGISALYPGVFPQINVQPLSQTVKVGASVTFSVSAYGVPTPSYQWYFKGNAIPNVNTPSIAIPSVQGGNAGSYTVLVINSHGSVLSQPAILNVVTLPPSIASQPQGKSVVAGANVAFSVVASGSPPLAYQWFRNGSIITGAMTATYTISKAQAIDSGDYKVRVSNLAGSLDSAVATLVVKYAPVISAQPQGQAVVVGGTAILNVTADGFPTPSYQWNFNGHSIAAASHSNFTIVGVTTNNAGYYNVTVTNAVGRTNSVVVTLTVINPPAAQPRLFSIKNGDPTVKEWNWLNGAFLGNAAVLSGANGASNSDVEFDGKNFYAINPSLPALISKFDSTGRYVSSIPLLDATGAALAQPQIGLATDGLFFYTIAAGDPRLRRFDLGGHYIVDVGSLRDQGGLNTSQTGIAADGQYFYTIAAGDYRIRKFDLTGNYLADVAGFNEAGTPDGSSTGIAVLPLPLLASVTIGNVTLKGGDLSFSFSTQTGHSYSVQSATTLDPSNWLTFTNIPGNGSTAQVTDSGLTNSSRYYRVAAH